MHVSVIFCYNESVIIIATVYHLLTLSVLTCIEAFNRYRNIYVFQVAKILPLKNRTIPICIHTHSYMHAFTIYNHSKQTHQCGSSQINFNLGYIHIYCIAGKFRG